jgi:hypothetical protein
MPVPVITAEERIEELFAIIKAGNPSIEVLAEAVQLLADCGHRSDPEDEKFVRLADLVFPNGWRVATRPKRIVN